MYVKVYASEKGNQNKGTCSGLVNYLEKENREIDKMRDAGIEPGRNKEYFFNQTRRDIQPEEVIKSIDWNKKGLHKEDAKFYELDVCPTKKEMAHIGNDPEKLKDYVSQNVMKKYAENFNRNLKPENLVWYGKVEYNRYYKKTDEEVKRGEASIGERKPDNNMHLQIIISRKDKDQKMSLLLEKFNVALLKFIAKYFPVRCICLIMLGIWYKPAYHYAFVLYPFSTDINLL